MPANTTIAIKDGAATPITHNFNPSSIDANGVALYKERVSGIPIGQPQLSLSVRAPAGNSVTYKVVGKLTMPKVVQTTDTTGKAVTSVDYSVLGTFEIVVPQKADKIDRTNIRALLSNALQHATVVSMIDDLEGVW